MLRRALLPCLLPILAALSGCDEANDDLSSVSQCSCRATPPETSVWKTASGETWAGSRLAMTVFERPAEEGRSLTQVIFSGSPGDGRTLTLQLYAPSSAYIAGEVTLGIAPPKSGPDDQEHAIVAWSSTSGPGELFETGSVRVIIRDGRHSGSVSLPNGETLTFEGPVDLTCATTEIPNSTKPGNPSIDPTLSSAFCSPLKALGVR